MNDYETRQAIRKALDLWGQLYGYIKTTHPDLSHDEIERLTREAMDRLIFAND